MKSIIAYTVAATLVAGSTAHQHQHHHDHARRHDGSKVEKRADVTEYVVAATEVVYEYEGQKVDAADAQNGLKDGKYVVVGETNPTYTQPAAAQNTVGGQFHESAAEVKPAAAPVKAVAKPAAKAKTTSEKTSYSSSGSSSSSSSGSSSGSSSSSLAGVNKKFPNNQIKCSEFGLEEYGAVALEWLGFGGYSGIQQVPDYTSASTEIIKIITGTAGTGCEPGSMCSYACPPGWQKTQWPKAQGSTKESVGGLYCNSDGLLELTREGYETLCEEGEGEVTIQNDLDDCVVTCRTDYPGTESMVIPAAAEAGSKVAVCNPNQAKYYIWDGSGTSAQYYVNKKGLSVEAACTWNSKTDPKGAGNWAPLILGAGVGADGNTYISLFPNTPTSTAVLDFNVEIIGGNSPCYFKNGKFLNGGCTTTVAPGKSATIRYY